MCWCLCAWRCYNTQGCSRQHTSPERALRRSPSCHGKRAARLGSTPGPRQRGLLCRGPTESAHRINAYDIRPVHLSSVFSLSLSLTLSLSLFHSHCFPLLEGEQLEELSSRKLGKLLCFHPLKGERVTLTATCRTLAAYSLSEERSVRHSQGASVPCLGDESLT